jgi:ribosomal-protein-alanine N-acetyltransferase
VVTNSTEAKGNGRPAASAEAAPLVVERLTHQDIPEICQLYRRVWEPEKGNLAPELVKAWQPTPLEFTSWMEGAAYFAARRHGRMVGAVGCELVDGSCQVVHLAVDPEARRQGVGSALTRAAIEWAKKNGSGSIWADVLSKFTGAAGVFKQLGFTECGMLHRHYWKEDVRLFEKILE